MHLRKDNTKKAYTPKVKEFKGFCDFLYPNDCVTFRYRVTYEKMYRFMFYQVFRNKKTTKSAGVFNSEDYEEVLNKYNIVFNRVAATESGALTSEQHNSLCDPTTPLGIAQINTYRSAIHGFWDFQFENKVNVTPWTEIYSTSVKKLVKIVAGRRVRVRKRGNCEKLDRDSEPFQSYNQVLEIERAYWLQGCSVSDTAPSVCTLSTFCSLRNRFNFLMNFSGMLRNESVQMAELSDCRHFVVQRKNKDHDPMPVFMLAIAQGKTCHDHPQYGRATRHVDVWQCPVGALAFYWLFRFHVNREFQMDDLPDLRVNANWFDMKLLCELGADSSKMMSQRPFQKSMSTIFKQLRISSSHKGHFGRVAGPIYAEFAEVPPELIKIQGKFLFYFIPFFVC